MKPRATTIHIVIGLCWLAAQVVVSHAQATNPPYLGQFPSPARVKAEIKGADAMDTAARQVGAFWQLQEIIKTLSGLRWTRGQLTPDEGRVIGQYRLGYDEAGKPYASFPEKSKWFNAYSFYEVDEGFREELFKMLLSPAVREQFFRVKGETKAIVDQGKAARAQALKEEQQQQEGQFKQPEWKRKLARCIASGRSESQCFSEQLGGEVDAFLSPRLGLNLQRPAGLIMNGVYAAPGGLMVAFGPRGAHVTCKAVSASANYAVRHEGGQVQIRLLDDADEWQGQRVALPVRPDGRLSGAGVLKVTGQVVVGHKKEWVTEQRKISEFEASLKFNVEKDAAGNLYVKEQVLQDVPIYAPKTEQCALGVLAPTNAATGPMVLASIFGGTDDAPAKMPAPGLRMTGTYKGTTGFEVEFHLDSAVLGCREAVVARDYSVTASAGRVTVNIKNGDAPLAVELRRDGELAGDGQVQINGRVMIGSNQRVDENTRLVSHDPVFQPISDTCSVGVLRPSSGAAGAGAVAGTDVAPTPPGQPAPAATATQGKAPAPAKAVLTVTSAFAAQTGAANPLASKPLVLFRESFGEFLKRKGMFKGPPGSPAKIPPLGVWAYACQTGSPACKQALYEMQPLSAGEVKTDAAGRGVLPAVQPGTYYLFALAPHNGRLLVWDLRVDIKPGANSVALDPRNSAPLN